ncbi:MAG: hypothetical protein APF80_06625 [Alphaproteobacteria bacterium BRH_c36]|nr:MAG: hypothetical protein APF80_06625 [Alphaproteobacteria bacterium BRH_c36]
MSAASSACSESWTKVDSDKNGTISKSEADAQTQAQFEQIDADGNGKISVKEWKACSAPAVGDLASNSEQSQANGGQSQPTSAQSQTSTSWDSKSFEEADTDKSGDISPAEAANASGKANGSDMASASDSALNEAGRFAAIDTDGNGSVTKSEWMDRENASGDKRFSALEKDGDGSLTKSEYQAFQNSRYSEAQQAQNDQDGKPEPTIWYYYFYTL